jgi:hypothetical protein
MTTVNANFSRIPAKAARAKLSQTDWAVLHAIGLHADKAGGAFPSMARIAEITGIKRHNVARAIGRIEQRGLVRRHRAPRPNGGWQVNHYELVYEPLGDVIPSDNTSHVISRDNRCSQHREQGVISSETLTNQLTNQGTDPYEVEESQIGESLSGRGVIAGDDIVPVRAPRKLVATHRPPTRKANGHAH